jgi:hypothetical protein
MDALNSLNPVRTRNRANSAVSTLPTPLSPEHTNHRHSQPDPNWRRSQPELSSSAPQASYLQSHPTAASSMDSRHTSTTNGTDGLTNSLSVDFEGGAHVIVRPNRIIRGKLEQKRTGALITDWLTVRFFFITGTLFLDLAEKTHVTRIRMKVRKSRLDGWKEDMPVYLNTLVCC